MGKTQSQTGVHSPFGGLPVGLASELRGAQLDPLIRGLGLGGDTRAQRGFEQRLSGATGPLADFIRGVRGFAPGVIGQSQGIGNQVAGQSQLDYNTLRSQIDQSLGALPNFQAAANQGLDFARQSAVDAYSPVRQQALFQQTSRNVLDPLRQSQAARGLESQGGAQQQEQNVLQNLGLSFAQNQLGQQQQALQGLQSAGQNALGTSQAGIGIAGQYAPALQNLQSGLSQQYLAPLQASGGLASLLSGGISPGIQLTGATSPQLGTSSKGGGFWGCCHPSVLVATPDGPRRIGDLTIGSPVYSLLLDGRLTIAFVTDCTREDKPIHQFTQLGSVLISPTHPLADSQLVGTLTDRICELVDTQTVDILVDSETGYYCVGYLWLGSTLDTRHRQAA
jgi:hypothetical protein